MILKVLGSGSAGNCYIFENDSEAMILEAGVKFSEVKKVLDFNIRKIVCCLITHEHKDHAGHINEFLNDGITVYASKGTINNTLIKGFRLPLILKAGTLLRIGGFKIIPFEAKHDAAEPVGFFINHEETGNFIFATDTYYIPCVFSNLSNILIEANYRQDILEENTRNGSISLAQRNRTLQSHMSYETCLKTLLANDLSKVNNIVLIHLSNDNSNALDFQEGIRKETGKTTHIADKGIVIELNKTPF
ncbi:MAG: MBL fold metallo-hydrolase [Flavobacteriaceae bacterium]|jgi:phosphoribosyl 1,2-cyclic phosphodiesterase|nr:MBL fold metallo-hydrolase [Flavobacteriaceae bacterium]